MKKRLWFFIQAAFLGCFVITMTLTLFRFLGSSNPLVKLNHSRPAYNNFEAYDPTLNRINSLTKLEKYCDSMYAVVAANGFAGDFDSTYTEIVSTAVRNRFYHGYSFFTFNNNYLALLASKVAVDGLGVPVLPDDVLKEPNAACSQQAVVMMQALQDKGIPSRKISFNGPKYGGHFAFEVYYGNSWHFHDPNMEPDKEVLREYRRPSIAFLAEHPDVLCAAYRHRPKELVMDIFPTYAYGPVNKFPAPRAAIFQKTTSFLSSTIWLFFLVGFLLARRKYLRLAGAPALHPEATLYQVKPETIPVAYPEYATRAS